MQMHERMNGNYPLSNNTLFDLPDAETQDTLEAEENEGQEAEAQEEIKLGDLVNQNELKKMMDHALQYGGIDELMGLFDNGTDINQTDFMDRTALMLYATKKPEEYAKAMEVLLERGADPNVVMMFQGRIPFTALDAARQTKNPAAVALLEGLENADGSRKAKTGREIAAEGAEKIQGE